MREKTVGGYPAVFPLWIKVFLLWVYLCYYWKIEILLIYWKSRRLYRLMPHGGSIAVLLGETRCGLMKERSLSWKNGSNNSAL